MLFGSRFAFPAPFFPFFYPPFRTSRFFYFSPPPSNTISLPENLTPNTISQLDPNSLVPPHSNTINNSDFSTSDTVGPLDPNSLINTVPHLDHQCTIHPTLPSDPSPSPEPSVTAPGPYPSLPPSMVVPPPNGSPDLEGSPAGDPPLHRSTCLHFPFSHTAMLDGLLLNPHVAMAISALPDPLPSTTSAMTSDDSDGNVIAFLAEFVPYCDTHSLIPLDVPVSEFASVSKVLAATANGSLEPDVDVEDDPLWSEAMASPEREYWITSAQDEVCSLMIQVKWCSTRSAMSLRASHNSMASIIIRQQHPPPG